MVERVGSDVSLPHGTVTFLFTDIEGSTRLLQELGDAYADVLAEHHRMLREEFARHGGVEVGTQGDCILRSVCEGVRRAGCGRGGARSAR